MARDRSPIDPPWSDPDLPPDPPSRDDPAPPGGPIPPGYVPDEDGLTEGDEGGGGGGGQGPWAGQWADWLGGNFFNQWQKGGYGFDPEWLRRSIVGSEDYWNQQRGDWYGATTENLQSTGRLYSGGPRSAMTRDIEEAYRENLGQDVNRLNIENLQSQFQGRQDFFNSLMGYITGERGYGLDTRRLDLAESGAYMEFLLGLLGMM